MRTKIVRDVKQWDKSGALEKSFHTVFFFVATLKYKLNIREDANCF